MLDAGRQPHRGAADSGSTTGNVGNVSTSLRVGSRTPAGQPAAHPAFVHTPLRRCARPDCSATAAVTLLCDYTARTVLMTVAADAPEVDDPACYDLCARHADRFRPPHGWELTVDVRTPHDHGPHDGGLHDVDPRELAAALG